MPVTLAQMKDPIDWTDAQYRAMLANLQGNILKGHGRDHTRNLFFKIDPAKKTQARAAIKKFAPFITRADDQLKAAERFKVTSLSGGGTLFFFLSAKGYDALGIPTNKHPTTPSSGQGCRPARTNYETMSGIYGILLSGKTFTA